MSFESLELEVEYRTKKADVVKEFYIPVLEEAISYKRAVGFFRSSALIDLSVGIVSLVNRGGTIQLIASPRLTEEDIADMEAGYRKKEQIIEEALLREVKEPVTEQEEKRMGLLGYLIANGIMEIKIAFIKSERTTALFHEKLGLLEDGEGNKIAFSGSMNETGTAFSHNYEAIDVFCNWKSYESKKRIEYKQKAFDELWNDAIDGMEVLDFPKVVRERFEVYNTGTYDKKLDETEKQMLQSIKKVPKIPEYVQLYDYQKEAIKNWEANGFRGIYDMATGTGKTYTGLASAVTLYQKKKGKVAILIVCPYLHLVDQWVEDLHAFQIEAIVGHSDNRQYKRQLKDAIFDFNLGVRETFCFICTNATFQMKSTQNTLEQLNGEILLMVDEAHNFGATSLRVCLKEQYTYRLALSATLDRHGDEEGTKALYDYFGEKCIEYTLKMAIDNGFLTKYEYYPIVTNLTEEEYEKYRDLSYELGKCQIIDKSGKRKLTEKGKKIAIKRSRVVAAAINKCHKLVEIMEDYRDKKHMLVYCGAANLYREEESAEEDIRQINYVTELLGTELGMRVARFTSEEDLQTRATLKAEFQEGENLQALIAIRCLDEGVNIPNIETAFILASSTNPKEYIQRRGRVLRKSKGKEMAVIYDFITLPRPLEEAYGMPQEELEKEMSLVYREYVRMKEFSSLAENPVDTDRVMEEIEEIYPLYKRKYREDDLDEGNTGNTN